MKKILTLATILIFVTVATAQTNNIYANAGIAVTVGAPTYKPGAKGSIVAIDSVTGTWYVSRDRYASNGNWLSMGQRIEQISGCSAPAYTPNKYNSDLVINNCAVPELYYHSGGGVWVQLNASGSTYTAGSGIAISGGNVISNAAPDQTVSLTGAGGNVITGTYPSFTITGTPATGAETIVTAGTGASVTGAGTSGSPYVVSSTITQYTDEAAQDAVGAMAGNTLTYTDATPLLDVKTQMSITSDASGVKLSGDAASPGNSKLYGTDGSGVKGWQSQPTGTTDLSISGSSSPLTINSSTGTDITATAGTGISLAGTIGNMTITNNAPDQTVALTSGTGISATGTYPNFTISNTGVTSAGLSLPSIFSVSNSPVTTTGTLTGTLATQTANTVFAGPTSGGAATPAFRALVAADLPAGTNLWTDGGADTYLTSTTDNVAIGATSAGSKLDIRTDALGVTQTNTSGLLLSNTTAAAAGAQQISPAIRWRGNGWKTNATAASQTVDFRADVRPVQGAANPTGALVFNASVNGATYGNQLFSIGSDGHISMGTSANSNYVLNVNNTTDQIAAVIGNFNFNNALNGGAGTGMGIAAFSGAAYLYNTNGAFSIKTATGFGTEQERLKAEAVGTVKIGTGNITTSAWGLSGVNFQLTASPCGTVDNSTAASATVTNNVVNSVAIPSLAATNASITYTNAANFYIAGAPTTSSGCGLNTPTLTNKYALWVDSDNTRLDGKLLVGGTGTPTDAVEVSGNIALTTAGNKLKIATGSNASIGTSTLVAGTVTVSTTAVATGSHIVVCYDTPAGTLASGLSAPTASIVNATSFVINSLTTAGVVNTLDTSTVRWWIIN